MDTSETVTGKRGRAPAQGATGSDILNQSQEKLCRVGHLHLAFCADEEVAEEHAQWWHPEMKSRLDAKARQDLSEPVVVDGMGAAMSALVAGERNYFWPGVNGGGTEIA